MKKKLIYPFSVIWLDIMTLQIHMTGRVPGYECHVEICDAWQSLGVSHEARRQKEREGGEPGEGGAGGQETQGAQGSAATTLDKPGHVLTGISRAEDTCHIGHTGHPTLSLVLRIKHLNAPRMPKNIQSQYWVSKRRRHRDSDVVVLVYFYFHAQRTLLSYHWMTSASTDLSLY